MSNPVPFKRRSSSILAVISKKDFSMLPRGRDESFVIVALSPLSRHCRRRRRHRRRRHSIENNINPFLLLRLLVLFFFYSLVGCAPHPSYATMKCTVALDKARSKEEMFKSVGNCRAIIQPILLSLFFHHFWRFIQTDFCFAFPFPFLFCSTLLKGSDRFTMFI